MLEIQYCSTTTLTACMGALRWVWQLEIKVNLCSVQFWLPTIIQYNQSHPPKSDKPVKAVIRKDNCPSCNLYTSNLPEASVMLRTRPEQKDAVHMLTVMSNAQQMHKQKAKRCQTSFWPGISNKLTASPSSRFVTWYQISNSHTNTAHCFIADGKGQQFMKSACLNAWWHA